jgi:hypothetical protein
MRATVAMALPSWGQGNAANLWQRSWRPWSHHDSHVNRTIESQQCRALCAYFTSGAPGRMHGRPRSMHNSASLAHLSAILLQVFRGYSTRVGLAWRSVRSRMMTRHPATGGRRRQLMAFALPTLCIAALMSQGTSRWRCIRRGAAPLGPTSVSSICGGMRRSRRLPDSCCCLGRVYQAMDIWAVTA